MAECTNDTMADGEVPVLTVDDLAHLVGDGLATLFPESLWVEGQVSGFHDARSGHAYFELVEPSDVPGRAVGAKFSVALFKGNRASVDRSLARAGGLTLSDDLLLRIRARLEFYGPHGKLQLIMDGVDPTFTLGQLAAERDRLLRTLADEGLLRANKALPIPVPPLRIGLVTSVGSAAHADFTQELVTSGLPFTVLECDARVQGDGAAVDLAEAVRTVATRRPDVVAVVRGGGSAADLAAFDAEVLARTIAGLDVPVITGIGHEVDRSVVDEVAHTAFKTPTACAAALIDQVRSYAEAVDTLAAAVGDRATTVVDLAEGLLGNLTGRTALAASTTLARHADRLNAAADRLGRAPQAGLDRYGDRLDAASARLRALDPARIVARGWSITRRHDGCLVRSVEDVEVGTTLVTTLTDGTVTSTVDPMNGISNGEESPR
ncbi:MAG: exodeoxyribonuclease VII large subunit [Acidimicrobiaceae bacterium]|nr:exodeoxyribonuclease VII large subunit [Acidimicrobiaceae bacterium]